MNGKKWVIAAVITVCVLALVALILGAVLVFQLVRALDDYETEESFVEEIFAPQEAVEETEAQVEATVAPVELSGQLGIVSIGDGDYDRKVQEAFISTCEESGVGCVLYDVGGDPLGQRDAIVTMLESGEIAGIAAVTLDPNILAEMCALAMEYGVPIVTMDIGMDAGPAMNALAHLDGWGSVEDIAYELLWAMADTTHDTGKFGVVAPFEDDPIYDSMEQQLIKYDKFKNTVWYAGGAGNGTDESCRDEIVFMLQQYDLDALICTDPQTTMVAMMTMVEMGMEVPIIGYAPPSMVADSSALDVVGIWQDPRTLGELAARSLIGAITGSVAFADGEFIHVGNGDSYRMEEIDGVLTMWVNPLWITRDNAEELRIRE